MTDPSPWSTASEPEALQPLRQRAAEALRRMPWPHPKDEAWRHSPLRALREAVEQAANDDLEASTPAPRLAEPLPEGVRFEPFGEALGRMPELRERIGSALPEGLWPLADANTVGFGEGWLLQVEPGVRLERPLRLRLPWSARALQRPRLLLWLGEAARASVLLDHDEGPEGALRIGTTEVLLEPSAQLEQLVLLRGGPARLLAHLAARLEQDASHRLLVLGLGGRHGRLELLQRHTGPRADSRAAAVLLAGEGEASDLHLRSEHLAPGGRSEQLVRAAAEAGGRAIADARVLVRRQAPGCLAEQRLDGLLLERGARVYCRPELTIEIDEVEARHGATVGALDESALHYLRSRGIGRSEAEALLRAAFLAVPQAALQDPALRAEAAEHLQRHLGHPLPTEPLTEHAP